jgi:Zinc knuckle
MASSVDLNKQNLLEKPSKMVTESSRRMVPPNSRDAPKFSSKKPAELRRFLRLMEDLMKDAGVEDDEMKKQWIVKYADQESEEEWLALDTYSSDHTWDEFKDELLENYPEAAAAERGTPARIRQLCKETREIRLGDLPALYAFRRSFMSEAKKLLKAPAAMANRELVELFIGCLSENLALALLQYLGNRVPSSAGKGKGKVTDKSETATEKETSATRRPEDKFDLEEVCQAAIQVSESSQGMFTLMKKEVPESVEERGVYLFNQPVSETKALSQKIEELEGVQALEKDRVVSMNKTMESKMNEIENLMKTLLAQSQTDANKGFCKGDCKGSGCRTHHGTSSNQPPKWGSNRSMENEKCFYCGEMGHFQADCDDLKEQVRLGLLKVNPEGKLRLKDGSFIPNQPPGATLKERVEKHYARRPSQLYYGEYEDEDSIGPLTSKYSSQFVNASDEADRRMARLEAELELRKREEVLELRKRKLELEEKKLGQPSGPSRATNLLDVLGHLTDDEIAAIKAARAGFH